MEVSSWKQQVQKKFNSLNPALLSSFFLFFYVKIELTISTVIASGSKSRAISRKQLFAYEWQVLIESIKNGIFQSNSPRSILNLMILYAPTRDSCYPDFTSPLNQSSQGRQFHFEVMGQRYSRGFKFRDWGAGGTHQFFRSVCDSCDISTLSGTL